MARIGLVLEPLDLLFFRDGRPFEAGIRVGSTSIFPQTLAGALRTALLSRAGCDFAALSEATKRGKSLSDALAEQSGALADIAPVSVGGPWFLRDKQPLVPMPASLLREEEDGEVVRLAPLRDELPGWTPEEPGMLPLWVRSPARAERLSGYLTIDGTDRFLRGEVPEPKHIVRADALFETDNRTGIVVDAGTLTVETSMIYSADYLSLKRGVSLYAELSGPEPILTEAFAEETAVPFGGQGRYVRIRRCEPEQWPQHRTGGAGSLLLLTTPGLFTAGWRPPGLDIVAAAVPGQAAVSGWDLARGGPKPTRFAAQAGSLYFCRGNMTQKESLCDGEDAALGWGHCLQGVWDYA